MRHFPCPQVIDTDLVVAIGLALLTNVDYGRFANQSRERDLIRRLTIFEKVDGGIEVRTAMFGGRKTVRRVEIASFGDARRPAH